MQTLKDLAQLSPDDEFWKWISSRHLDTLVDAVLLSVQPPSGSAAVLTENALRALHGAQEMLERLRRMPRHPKDLRALLEPQHADDPTSSHGV